MFFKAHPWLWLAIGLFLVSTWAHLDDHNHGIIKARGLQGADKPEHAFDVRAPKKAPSKPNTPKVDPAPATTKVQAPPPVTTKKVDAPTTSKAQVPTTTPVVTSAKVTTSSVVLSTSKSSSSSSLSTSRTSSSSSSSSSSTSSSKSASSTSTALTTSSQTTSSSTALSSSIPTTTSTTAQSSSASVSSSSSISGTLSTTIQSSSASATISSSATGTSTDTTVVQSKTGSVSSQSLVSTASVSTAVSTTTALSSSSDATAGTAATATGTQSSNSLSSGSTTATETGVITSSSSVTGSLTTGLTTTFTSSGNATAKITASRTHTSTTTGNGTTSATSTATRISQQKCAPGAGGKCSGTLCTLGKAVTSDDSDTTDTAKRAAENEFDEPLLLEGRESAVTARGYPISFSRRAFLDPTKDVDFETLSSEPNVKDLSTFGASDSDWVNFGTAKQSAFVDGLIGCSVVTIVSPTGFRSFHLWEYPGYNENTGTLQIDPATTLYSGGTNMEHLRKRLAALTSDLESAKAKAGDGARVHIMMPRANVKASTIGAKWRYNTDKIFAWTKTKTKFGKFDLTTEVDPPARVAETIIDAVKSATGIEPEMCDYYPVKTVPKGQPYRGRWVLQYDPQNTAGASPHAVNIWCEKDSQFDDGKAFTW